MNQTYYENCASKQTDHGPAPFVVNIRCAAIQNTNYRTALWTGKYLQVTLMSIPGCGDIGLEMHPNLDQFIRVEEGLALVTMGKAENALNDRQRVAGGDAILIPAGTWHNIINQGRTPLKLYSIYAPPQHPYGTVHRTKEEAEAAEHGE